MATAPAADDSSTRERKRAPARVRLGGLKDVRQRFLRGATAQPEFEHELMLMFVRNELSAQATILLLAMTFTLASMFWAPWTQAVLWLILVIGSKVLLLELCRRIQALPASEIDLPLWRQRLLLAEATNGVCWAGFALVGIQTSATMGEGYLFTSHVFVFASLIVVLAIRMTFASSVMPILYVGTIPMTIAVVARLLSVGDYFYVALATMAAGVHVYFIFLAKGLNSTALAMLQFRAQKDALIAELEQAKSISDEARRRAEDANVAKSRFLATMSHELRTPLNAILGFSEVMQAEVMGPINNPRYKEYAGNIHQSGSHLLHLINEILDLSRIEAGRYELNEEAHRLADIVDDCHRLLKLRIDGKALRIVKRFDENLPQVWVDERAVRQICLNLLSNALKFTPTGGQIVLTVARTSDGGQVIRVRDTGPGIPKEELPKVLQAFGQGALAQRGAEGGTGLGLPIVKKLIDMHGGRFELKSELGKGTLAAAYVPPKRVLQVQPSVQHLRCDLHHAHRGRTNGATAAEMVPPTRPARLRRSAERTPVTPSSASR